jgi:hypothetical protein
MRTGLISAGQCLSVVLFLLADVALASGIAPFVGEYAGYASVERDGQTERRNMSVEIQEQKKGFSIKWETMIHTAEGNTRKKSYNISFRSSQREGIYASAMKTNVFGHEVPLDPLAGEPYVWARIRGDTLTVHSLHIDESGGYEIQRYDRTLVPEGLKLDFASVRDGEKKKAVGTLLQRQ